MLKKAIQIAAIAFSLTGCATYEAVNSGTTANVGGDVSVDPQVAWAKLARPNISSSLWTIDGLGLDELYFFTDVKSGQPLVKVKSDDKKTANLLYNDTMLPNDVMDLMASTLEALGYQQVHASGLAPAPFGKTTGFRFNLDFSTQSGLEMKGTALAAQRGPKLDVILFTAPNEYYFGHYSPLVDKLFASVQTSGATGAQAALKAQPGS